MKVISCPITVQSRVFSPASLTPPFHSLIQVIQYTARIRRGSAVDRWGLRTILRRGKGAGEKNLDCTYHPTKMATHNKKGTDIKPPAPRFNVHLCTAYVKNR